MLSYSQIADTFPPLIRDTKPRGILREYLQYLILRAVYMSPYGRSLVFLGGTCLRIVYGSGRFSEDIDFDNRGLSEDDWEKMGASVVRSLKNEGIEAEMQFVYKGAFHCYVRIPQLLQDMSLTPYKDEKILIQLDTVWQGFDYDGMAIDIDAFGIASRVLATPRDILLSQKIRAAYERKRSKGRDFYDIRFMRSMKVEPNYGYLAEKMNIENQDQLRRFMSEKNKNIDFDALARDVEPFLFRSEDARLVREFAKWEI